MKIARTYLLVLVLMAGWFACLNLVAQTPPVVLTLKGVGVGSSASMNSTGSDVQVAGSHAYLAWRRENETNHPGGFEIFSVTNPSAPVRVGGYECSGHARAVRVASHYAYLAVGTACAFTNDSGAFEIIDVDDVANPVRVGAIDTLGRPNGICIAGHHAYVAESTRWTGSNFLGALEIFDVSTPTNPVRVAAYDTGGSAMSVDVSGGHAFLADGVADLQVLDVSDPANPRRVGGYDTDEWNNLGGEHGGPATRIKVVGSIAYSAGEDGLHVLDVSDAANPARLSGINYVPFHDGFDVSGRYACAGLFVSSLNRYVLVISDMSDPANPVGLGFNAIGGVPTALQVVDRSVYLATLPLLVYEISDVPAIKSIARSGGRVVLTWGGVPGFHLQRTAALDDPLWSEVPGSAGQSRIELPMISGTEFFRLARPW